MRFRYDKNYVFYLFLTYLFLLLVLFVNIVPLPVSNTIFVDGYNWYYLIKGISSGEIDFDYILSSHFFIYLNYFFYIVFGFFSFLILNLLLLGLSFTFPNFLLAFLAIPFFIVTSLLPSKDILVLFFTVLFAYLIIHRYLFLALLISIIVFFVRDGHGIFLLIFLFLFYFNFFSIYSLFFVFSTGVLMDYFLYSIQNIYPTFLLGRVLNFFQDNDFSPYIIRLFGNIFNLSSRATFFTESYSLSITSFSLFMSGIVVSAAFISSIFIIFRKKYFSNLALLSSYFTVYAFLFFSISPMVQPRYLIPISFVYFYLCKSSFVTYNHVKNSFLLSFSINLILYMIYLFLGDLPIISDFNYTIVDLYD